MKRPQHRIAAIALLAGAAISCAPAQQRQRQLVDTAREFNNDLRWGRYETAIASIAPDEGRRFLARVEMMGDELVIADQDITEIKIGRPDTKATTHVRLDWYTQREPVIHRTFIEQQWEWNGRWLVTRQRRIRGDRFPLVPEPTSAVKPGGPDAGPDGGVAPAGPSPG